ncbi:TrkH family potassium uptake protein [Corynebacterium aquilae]|uniref:TrkH family potassium uptake protein n=1 Tax=Corynebacterium aquilae TaxID=203263 RepID=UPI000952CDCD|nr:potassium transporter TrkG [Corynebacterium aquilae]
MSPKKDSPRRKPVSSALSPAQLVAGSFASFVLIGTVLLLLPISRADGAGGADFVTALFTATSATCLTGLIVVDTATYWSHFGQVVIMLLIQAGGLGIMTLATIASWVIAGQIGVKSRLNASAEGRGAQLGDVKTLLVATLSFTAAVEFIIACFLVVRFRFEYGMTWEQSLWWGIFHSISAFNNAGFSLHSDNLVPFVSDAGLLLPIAAAIMIGGLGFPLLLELALRLRRRTQGITHLPRVSLTTKFVLIGTTILITTGFVGFGLMEWNGALSHLSTRDKILSAFFQSVSTRTAGFNSVDFGEFHPSSLILTDFMMFIGGGSGGTAGGVKITTVAVLVAVMIAEIRGDDAILFSERRIPNRTMRQALAVFMLAGLLVAFAISIVQLIAPEFTTHQIVFEVISAFATVGLSTGITAALPTGAKLIITVLMYAGRIGPITLVAAMAAREQRRLYNYPVERPLIG